MDSELIEKTAELILNSKKGVVALTGAGISVDSGIPAFRGSQGLWEKFDPMEYAHIDAFIADPLKIWSMLKELGNVLREALPNPAHRGLAELEQMGFLRAIITQNVDALHQEAGSMNVIEFHGNWRYLVCLYCHKRYERDEFPVEMHPPVCKCGAILKPDAVFFGEPIPSHAFLRSHAEVESCDLMLVIGTSAVVAPASELPALAKKQKASVVEINPEPTPLTGFLSDFIILESASLVVPLIVEEIKKKVTGYR